MTSERGDQPAGEWPELMTPTEVATLFRVSASTVSRWADEGRLRSVRTLGGHRRFPAAEIRQILDGGGGGWPGTTPDLAEEL